MSLVLAIVEGLARSALSVSLRASEWVYPMVNTLHIVGIALLVGPILILDWRVLRSRVSPAVWVLETLLLPTARAGFALAVAAGLLLFIARPVENCVPAPQPSLATRSGAQPR